jgi:hypothetical protein
MLLHITTIVTLWLPAYLQSNGDPAAKTHLPRQQKRQEPLADLDFIGDFCQK